MLIHKLEDAGEILRANIRYDLDFKVDSFEFFNNKNKHDNYLKNKLDKTLNRKITADDKL